MKKIVYISILSILFTCFNCSEFKSEISYVKNLKNEISKTYNLKEAHVKMTNNDDLKIELKNSRFNDYTPE